MGKYMEKKTKRQGTSSGAWCLRKIFFSFYALLAERFSIHIRRVRGQGARRSTRTFVTMLTALTIHLLKKKIFRRILTRFAARFFAQRFFFAN